MTILLRSARTMFAGMLKTTVQSCPNQKTVQSCPNQLSNGSNGSLSSPMLTSGNYNKHWTEKSASAETGMRCDFFARNAYMLAGIQKMMKSQISLRKAQGSSPRPFIMELPSLQKTLQDAHTKRICSTFRTWKACIRSRKFAASLKRPASHIDIE